MLCGLAIRLWTHGAILISGIIVIERPQKAEVSKYTNQICSMITETMLAVSLWKLAYKVAVRGCGQSIEPVSKQILFIDDLLFIDHFSVSGDVRNHSVT